MVLKMGNKKVFLLLCSLSFILILSAGIVFAQQGDAGGFLESVFKPFAGINLAEIYDSAANFIDAMFYFLFFIGIVQFALSGYFKGRGGTAVVISFGAALAIGLAIWTSKIGFRLGDRIGPIAGAIFAILFFVMMVRLFKGEGSWGPAFWIAYLLGFVFINFFVPEVFTAFNKTRYGSIVIALANLLFFISLIYGVPRFLSQYWGGGGDRRGGAGGEGGAEGGAGGGFGGLFGGGRREPETPEDRRGREERNRERELLQSEGKLIDRILNTDVISLNRDTQIRDLLEQIRDALSSRELRSNKLRILQKLRSLAKAVENGEKIDKGVGRIMEENKRLLSKIHDLLELLTNDDKDKSNRAGRDLKEELRKKLGRRHDEVYKELADTNKTSTRIESINAFLTQEIEAKNTQRINFFKEMKPKLEESIEEFSEDEPKYGDIRISLKEAIDIIVQIIGLDNDIIAREREMYRENKFMEHISKASTPVTGP